MTQLQKFVVDSLSTILITLMKLQITLMKIIYHGELSIILITLMKLRITFHTDADETTKFP